VQIDVVPCLQYGPVQPKAAFAQKTRRPTEETPQRMAQRNLSAGRQLALLPDPRTDPKPVKPENSMPRPVLKIAQIEHDLRPRPQGKRPRGSILEQLVAKATGEADIDHLAHFSRRVGPLLIQNVPVVELRLTFHHPTIPL
jgi:hypothetical protein